MTFLQGSYRNLCLRTFKPIRTTYRRRFRAPLVTTLRFPIYHNTTTCLFYREYVHSPASEERQEDFLYLQKHINKKDISSPVGTDEIWGLGSSLSTMQPLFNSSSCSGSDSSSSSCSGSDSSSSLWESSSIPGSCSCFFGGDTSSLFALRQSPWDLSRRERTL